MILNEIWKRDCKILIIYDQTGTTQSPGGQQAGMPSYSIRITHGHTGIMAQYGEGRSQHENKRIAFEMVEWGLTQAGWLRD